MKKIAVLLLLAIAAFAIYWFAFKSKTKNSGPALQPLALKKHSEEFNKSVATAMGAYFEIKNAFVNADTVTVKDACKKFIVLLDGIKLEELKKDTASIFETAQANLNDVKMNAASLLKQTDITEMRHDFSMVSEMMYPSFFKAINYEGENMYWQNCPMAFGDDKGANWISNTQEIINPYLGKNHPEFKGTMLHCGEIKDTIKAK
jgi:flagellar basal body-associated protein FliL